jgi:predicted site-specific integrase-resolvase
MRKKEFLTSAEVRAILRCSGATVRRYLAAGHLTAVVVNQRRFLYRTDAVAAFLGSRPDRGRHGA